MGDAGPPTPIPFSQDSQTEVQAPQNEVRDIHVLVTGFGAFKSFTNNPSYLIASALPKELDPLPTQNLQQPPPSSSDSKQHIQHPLAAFLGRSSGLQSQNKSPPAVQQPLRPPNNQPYRIHVHTYPAPVHVAYAPTSVLIPSLLDRRTNAPFHLDFDYVFHIGLASGRDSYTLETNAHRDDYEIKDMDDQEGFLPGEKIWKSLTPPIPERLEVGWLPTDVQARWETEVERRQDIKSKEMEKMLDEMSKGNLRVREQLLNSGSLREPFLGRHSREQHMRRSRRAVVKLSRDAGRYLCEFILMCSLVHRYRDGRSDFDAEPDSDAQEDHESTANPQITPQRPKDDPSEKVGKVAFLHVPNGTEPDDIVRGRMVAECAIQAFVASWEAGYRNSNVYSAQTVAETSADAPLRSDHIQAGFQTETPLHIDMQISDSHTTTTANSAFETLGTGDA